MRCVHYVGFRDDRYWNAFRIWGGPRIIHRWWDKRALRDIGPNDIVVFADGEWTQQPKPFNSPDIDELCSPITSRDGVPNSKGQRSGLS